MRNLRQELRSEVARHAPAVAPNLDSLVVKARHRQVRRRIIGATATAALTVLVMAFGVTVLVPDRSTGGDVGGSDLDDFSVPTSDWKVGQPAQQAMRAGVLGFTENGCPYLANEGAEPLGLIFPVGARGAVTVDGRRSVVDPDGFLFGAEGDAVEYGGGGYREIDPVHNPCEVDTSIVGNFAVQIPPGNDKVKTTR